MWNISNLSCTQKSSYWDESAGSWTITQPSPFTRHSFYLCLTICDHIYYGISTNDREVLQKLQNCAFRSILNINIYTHTADTHNMLNMDHLDDRRKKHVSVQMYKFLKCNGPVACKDMFVYMSDYHEINTRSTQTDDLLVPRVNLSMTHRNIRYFGPKIWKEIPLDIRSQPTLDLFKEHIYLHKFWM